MRKGFSLAVTLVMVLLMAGAVPKSADAACVSPPSGMVSWWGGDNNALDIIGTNNGTLNGVTYAAGKVSQAFSFDGTDDYVNVPYSSSLDLQGSLTITAWINSTNNSSLNRGIAGKILGWQIYVEDGGLLVFGFYNGSGGWTLLHSSIHIPENAWVQVAGTFNSTDGTLQIYINGASDTSLVTAERWLANANPLMIGGFGSDGAPFSGRIDEVGIFNRALSASEIAAIYTADSEGMCRPSVAAPSGLISWWKGENNANDQLGVNNGTPMNGAIFAPGKVGQAFSLDGVDDYVEVPHSASLNLTSGLTLMTWFKLRSSDAVLFSKGDSGASQSDSSYTLEILPDGSINVALYGTYPADWWQTAAGLVTTGQWYHVATTWDGTYGPSDNVKLYLNGALIQTWTKSLTPLNATTQTLTLGSMKPPTYYHHMDGLIDEPAIFSMALSTDEIATIYNAGSSGMTPIDMTPDAFNFSAQTGMPLSTSIISNPITVTGINNAAGISITGGDYSISTDGGSNWSAYSSTTPATVSLNNQVKVRQTSSANPSTPTTATLTIGGVTADFNVTTAASDDPNASGLVSWWRAENNAYDSVGGNHGTAVNGATYATGRVGQAFSFDGSGAYIFVGDPVPASLQIQNEITLSAWIYVAQYPSGDGMTGLGLIAGSQRDGSAAGATIFIDGRTNPDSQTAPPGHIHFQIGDSASWHTTNTNSQVPLNQWVHIVATRKAGEDARIYYNGVPQPLMSVPWGGAISYNNAWFAIGQQKDVNRRFNGLIDEVKIFNRALSALEVSTLAYTKPDAFSFTAQTGVPLSTPVESNSIAVTGISSPASISITGGAYSISTNGGSTWGNWTCTAGTVALNNQVKVRQTSSASYSTLTTATLTIGGVSGSFDVTTMTTALLPIPVAGLRIWLKADTGITKDGSNLISAWADQSGNGFNVGQGDSSKQPLFMEGAIGGNPAMRFDGADDYLQTPGTVNLLNGAGNYTMFLVVKPGPTQKTHADIIDYTHGSNVSMVVQQAGDATNQFGVIGSVSEPLSSQAYQIFSNVYADNTSSTVYLNGANRIQATTFPAISWSEPNYFTVGSKSLEAFPRQFNGDVAEAIVYNAAMCDTDRQSVESYLLTKYGIDLVPNAFSFIDQAGMPLGTEVESNPITVSGINSTAPISITGYEYAVSSDNGATWGGWTTSSGTVGVNNQVKVRVTSSSAYNTTTEATLTIGGVSDTFTVTTEPEFIINPVTTPTNRVTQAISGTVKSGATVTVSLNGGTAQTATVAGTNWSFTVTGLHQGDNAITANATYTGYAPTKSATISCTAPQLTVTVTGTGDANGMGGGTITSDPAAIACISGPCSALFDGLLPVALIPTPNGDSLFSGWSDACTAPTGNCEVTMPANMNAGDTSVGAAFAYVLPAQIQQTGVKYPQISEAYAALTGSGTIMAREFLFTGGLNLNRGFAILLKGGYNPAYSLNSGYSTIHGTLTMGTGSLTVERVIIK